MTCDESTIFQLLFTVLAILSTICPFIINVIAQIINFSRTPKCWMISVSTTVIFYIVEVEWENTGFSYALSNISGKYRFCLICRGEAKFCEKKNKINIGTFFNIYIMNIIFGIFNKYSIIYVPSEIWRVTLTSSV